MREVRKKYKTYQNLCVKMYNEQGVQAISQRSESFKGVIGGKYDCLALSAHDRSRPIDILYVGESIIDCISHYQLHHEKSPQEPGLPVQRRNIDGRSDESAAGYSGAELHPGNPYDF